MLWLAQKPDLAAIRRQTARPVGRDTELLQET